MISFCQELLVSFLGWCALCLPLSPSFKSPSALRHLLEQWAGYYEKWWSQSKTKTKPTHESLQGAGANVCLALFHFCWHKVKMHKVSWRMSVLFVTPCRCVTEWCRKPVWFSLLLTLLPHQPQHHPQLSAASSGHWALLRPPCPPREAF